MLEYSLRNDHMRYTGFIQLLHSKTNVKNTFSGDKVSYPKNIQLRTHVKNNVIGCKKLTIKQRYLFYIKYLMNNITRVKVVACEYTD